MPARHGASGSGESDGPFDPDRPAPDRPAPDRPAPDRPAPDRPAPDRPAPDRPAPDRPAPIELDPARLDRLTQRLAEVRARIAGAARAAGRDPDHLTLIAVSKTYPPQDVVMMHTLGVRHFAENREQEAGPKVSLVTRLIGGERSVPAKGTGDGLSSGATGSDDPIWHFVGQLQRNKARSVLRWADWVQSVDRVSLVPVLSRLAMERGRPLSICLQVSLDLPGASDGKIGASIAGSRRGGIDPAGLSALADLVEEAPGLALRGVMAVAPRRGQPRPAFARLREVAERLKVGHPQATVISAGMSGDLEDAVAEGATHLRIGTALFGERPGVP
ncbi:YggS family pyridoxal phosphate enzyme [Frankia sp. BMG5.23]|uniref:YggS family pyridoxal phosphate enzyme n=1 Tax=Frankia sp. BMG5.23 TaxID=683305 RepID=UPI001F4409A4|nr:YggS family pyridoxal phosphate enzyme [Frankia sp. BMG5.23]